ncbi:c-type cytochrome [Psychroflexus tropicus]|uniref:c-type cytochrome n=1 Tax=Psychroflexus tropicus TaxID=197345 RepID=UPI0003661A24|nr:c-type cytochrome [Psychroflexus tropicus]
MKSIIKISAIILLGFAMACGGNEEKKDKDQIKISNTSNTGKKETTPKATQKTSTEDDMANIGIGPITSVEVGDGIDEAMAGRGKEVFNNLCTACHKMDKKFVGPAISGVTKRRSPEWIMNMILNPEEMIKKDPIAKRLLVENNMAVMANQNVSEEDARAILEYFRQIDNQ